MKDRGDRLTESGTHTGHTNTHEHTDHSDGPESAVPVVSKRQSPASKVKVLKRLPSCLVVRDVFAHGRPSPHESEWAHGFGSPRTPTQSAARIGISGSQPAHAAGGSGKAGHDAQLASSPIHRAAQSRSQPATHRHRAELRTVAARSRRRHSQIYGRSRGQWRWRHKYPNVEQWHGRVRWPGSLSPLRLILGASR